MFFRRKSNYFFLTIIMALLIFNGSTYAHANGKISTKIDIQAQVEKDTVNIKEKWRIGPNSEDLFKRKLNIDRNELTNFNAQLIFPNEQNLDYKINGNTDISISYPDEIKQEIILEISYSLNKNIKSNSMQTALNKILFDNEQGRQISLLNIDIKSNDNVNEHKQYKNIQLNAIGKESSKNTDNKENTSTQTTDSNFFKDIISFISEFVLISISAIIALVACIVGIEFYKHKSIQKKRAFKLNKNNFKKNNFKKRKYNQNRKFKK